MAANPNLDVSYSIRDIKTDKLKEVGFEIYDLDEIRFVRSKRGKYVALESQVTLPITGKPRTVFDKRLVLSEALIIELFMVLCKRKRKLKADVKS